MKNSETRGRRCRFEEDIPAYLQGELPAEARNAFEAHLPACPSCAKETGKYRVLMQRLAAPLPEAPERDLAPAVLARIHAPRPVLHAVFGGVAWRAAAALLALLLAGFLIARLGARPGRQAAATPQRQFVVAALDWLAASQEPDGHWDAAKWGAQPNYTPGITALAVLAFLRQEAEVLPAAHAEAVRRGLDYLLGQQNAQGRFGKLCSGTPYNQGLATLALLKGARLRADPRWTQAADRGAAYIASTQLESGGWDYPRSAQDAGNTSVTAWQLQALLEAEAGARGNVRPAIDRGMAWLGRMMDDEGRIGYSRPGDFPNGHLTLTAAAALCLLRDPGTDARAATLGRILRRLSRDARGDDGLDYYRAYFLAEALRAAGDGSSGPVVARLQETLLACQAQTGSAAGSCEARDPWSSAGGRVYATAMAVLAM